MYQCPKRNRYGMEWDGRAKVLLCYYSNCNHVIRMKNQKKVPSVEVVLDIINKERVDNETPNYCKDK